MIKITYGYQLTFVKAELFTAKGLACKKFGEWSKEHIALQAMYNHIQGMLNDL